MNPKEKKKAKVREQMEIVSKAKTEQRDLTEEERRRLDELQREIDELDVEIRSLEGSTEPPKEQKGNQRDAGENVKQKSEEDILQAERTRTSEIMNMCREFGMDASTYIREGKTLDQVRAAVVDQMMSEHKPIGTRGDGDITVTRSEEDKFRNAAADALLMRGGLDIKNPADGANSLRAMSLRDLAIETLTAEGHSGMNRKSADEIFNMLQRAYFNPSAAFPAIMDNAINKAYVEGHKTVNVTFDRFTKKGSLKDFKTHDNYYLAGPAGEFFEVPEGGELKMDKPTDEKMPTRKLRTYGRQFSMSRQAFINDDIDFLSTVPAKYAAAARRTLNEQVYRIMCNNSVVYDGTPLYSGAHKNVLAKGTGITREAMQKMIMGLQTQVDQFGKAIIVNPAAIVVPSGYAFDIYTILYSPTINTSENTQATNPLYRYREMIEVIEDPTINVICGGFGNVMPWFLIGSKADTDFIEVDYLNGQEIPTIRRMETPGQLGFVWDIYLDWGVSVMDYRGSIMNPGIKVEDPLV